MTNKNLSISEKIDAIDAAHAKDEELQVKRLENRASLEMYSFGDVVEVFCDNLKQYENKDDPTATTALAKLKVIFDHHFSRDIGDEISEARKVATADFLFECLDELMEVYH